MVPCASRLTCQQSSILTYWYPASRIPLVTMASAVSRISCSLTWQANRFQLFQPMGGVFARVARESNGFTDCAEMPCAKDKSAIIAALLMRFFVIAVDRGAL